MKKQNKYHNHIIKTPDGKFHSEKEYRRWRELKLLEKAGVIKGLERQVKFPLTPQVRDPQTNKVRLWPLTYIADFVYTETETGENVVEDCKGLETAEFKIKEKVFYDRYKTFIRKS